MSFDRKFLFGQFEFSVASEVYEPAEDSALFAENLAVEKGERVLDMGTGCGILAVIAASSASHVVGIDISPHAIRCAKENAALNRVGHKISFLQGDLLAPIRVGVIFDLILFNAPYLPIDESDEESWIERSWAGGVSGRKLIDTFINEAPQYLESNGRIMLLQSTLSDVEESLCRFEEEGLKPEIIARKHLPFFEEIVLIEAVLGSKGCCQAGVCDQK